MLETCMLVLPLQDFVDHLDTVEPSSLQCARHAICCTSCWAILSSVVKTGDIVGVIMLYPQRGALQKLLRGLELRPCEGRSQPSADIQFEDEFLFLQKKSYERWVSGLKHVAMELLRSVYMFGFLLFDQCNWCRRVANCHGTHTGTGFKFFVSWGDFDNTEYDILTPKQWIEMGSQINEVSPSNSRDIFDSDVLKKSDVKNAKSWNSLATQPFQLPLNGKPGNPLAAWCIASIAGARIKRQSAEGMGTTAVPRESASRWSHGLMGWRDGLMDEDMDLIDEWSDGCWWWAFKCLVVGIDA